MAESRRALAFVGVTTGIITLRVASELYLRWKIWRARQRAAMRAPYAVGHRCACGEGPENTLAAALHAVESGAQWLQVDVMLTKDRVPIVLHDSPREATLRRLTGLDAQPHEVYFADIPPLRAELAPFVLCDADSKIAPARFGADGCRICTLEEMLVAVGPDVGVLVEFWGAPDADFVRDVAAIVRKLGRVHSTALGNPFSLAVAAYVDAYAPDIRRIYHVRELARIFALYWVGLLPFMGYEASAPRRLLNVPLMGETLGRLTRRMGLDGSLGARARLSMVKLALGFGLCVRPVFLFFGDVLCMPTFGWVLNTKADWHLAMRLGCQGVMTDYVSRFMAFDKRL